MNGFAHDLLAALAERLSPSQDSIEWPKPPRLKDYVTKLLNVTLDPWQVILCDELEARFLQQQADRRKNQLVFTHAPPQWGKSVIQSVYFPAWAIGVKPDLRVGICTYNIEKSKEFTAGIRDALASADHQEFFPNPMGHVKRSAPAEAFSTPARMARRDVQRSVKAIGITTGATGRGFDLLDLDDLYASPEDAESAAINRATCDFVEKTVMARLHPGVMVAMAMHRYHHTDAGNLVLTKFGKLRAEKGLPAFHFMRFPTFADGNLHGDDPTGREPGELLSPRMEREIMEAIRDEQPEFFRAYHQGEPGDYGGTEYKRSWFDATILLSRSPLKSFVRAWDVAVTANKGSNFTASALGGFLNPTDMHLYEVTEDKVKVNEIIDLIYDTSLRDPKGTMIAIEDTGITAKIISDMRLDPRFMRTVIIPVPPLGKSKAYRFKGFAAMARNGHVWTHDCTVPVRNGGLDVTSSRRWKELMLSRLEFIRNLDTDVDDVMDAIAILWTAAIEQPAGIAVPDTEPLGGTILSGMSPTARQFLANLEKQAR